MTDDLTRRLAAAKKGGSGGCGDPLHPCPGPPCSAQWRAIRDDVGKVAAMKDPITRNRQISARYAKLYQSDPRLRWVGLAGIVSRQAGCAMGTAKEKSESYNPFVAKPAGTAYEALAEGNGTIFSDIYPAAQFYHQHGLARLKQCAVAGDGTPEVSPDLIRAFEQVDTGTPQGIRRGADIIANYEQTNIIQDEVYANAEYKKAFERNEWWAKNAIGRYFGAQAPELPLSDTCTQEGKVPFSGSITDPKARVNYYHELMNRYEALPQGERDRMADSIIRQAIGH